MKTPTARTLSEIALFGPVVLLLLLLAGGDGLARTLAGFDLCSDSVGLFILALVVALVGQSLRGRAR